jgi:hypothetical protein
MTDDSRNEYENRRNFFLPLQGTLMPVGNVKFLLPKTGL